MRSNSEKKQRVVLAPVPFKRESMNLTECGSTDASPCLRTNNRANRDSDEVSFMALAAANSPSPALSEISDQSRSETEGQTSRVSLQELFVSESESEAESPVPLCSSLVKKTRRLINKEDSLTLPLLALTNTRNLNPGHQGQRQTSFVTKNYLDSLANQSSRKSVFRESPLSYQRQEESALDRTTFQADKQLMRTQRPARLDLAMKPGHFSRTKPTTPRKQQSPHPLLLCPAHKRVWIGQPEQMD